VSEETTKRSWTSIVFTRRWLAYFLGVLVFATACVGLSMWQFDRRDQARAEVDRVLENYDAVPSHLEMVLPELEYYTDSVKWKPVVTTGTYLEDEQLLVRSRPYEGRAGVEVLTPLLTDSGAVFIVNRGWIPVNIDPDQEYDIPSPPSGEVTVVARLKPGEPGIAGREMSEGQVATIELPLIASVLDRPTYTGAYGLLASENPSPIEDAPLAAPLPALDEGAHLSYAYQWIAFGVLAFIALVWAVRNELKVLGYIKEKPRKKPKAPSEEEIVDALLDEQR
jgi:cytochrome oxidase assembly protein ShyY1